jgi:hypothetical protein
LEARPSDTGCLKRPPQVAASFHLSMRLIAIPDDELKIGT